MGSRLFEIAAFLVVGAAVVFTLSRGSDVLIPLAIAGMAWYLLNAFSRVLRARVPYGERLPHLFWIAISLVIAGAVLAMTMSLLAFSLGGISEAAPKYQENLNGHLQAIADALGMGKAPGVDQLLQKIDLKWAVGGVAGIATVVAGDMGLIFVYVLFLILEQESFGRKMKALMPDSARRAAMSRLLDRIQASIREYLWIKTLMCLLVGVLTFAGLKAIGVEYAFFWAFVAFLSNYIPTVGSLVGIALPAVFALLQFQTPTQSVVVLVGLFLIHFVVGNVLEPKLMGGKLNVSAFVVILSLVVWGKLWGITGMFLCVPITVVTMIVLAHFPKTRPVAVLLSENGNLQIGSGDQ